MKMLLLTPCLVLFLVACGGGGSGDSSAVKSCDIPAATRAQIEEGLKFGVGGAVSNRLGGEVVYKYVDPSGEPAKTFTYITIEPCFAQATIDFLKERGAWWGH